MNPEQLLALARKHAAGVCNEPALIMFTADQLAAFHAEVVQGCMYICENGEGDYGDRAEAIRAKYLGDGE